MNSEAARMFISAVDGEELCWSREPAVRLRQMRYAHGVMVRAVLAAISEGRAEITVAMMAGAISADPD